MSRSLLVFWLGVAVAFGIVALSASATTFEAGLSPSDSGITLVQRADGSVLSELIPTGLTIGSVRFTKHSWGILTSYRDDVSLIAAGLARASGQPFNLRITLTMPGSVTGTNATGRQGGALLWVVSPTDTSLWAESRAVNWPVLSLFAAAAVVSWWLARR